ncbi:MAG TPA: LLM class F420-dependent oxidoreductase [Acidimicrobiales bacterium]|jgi:probable F420-dependent oxidoreductase|nr:LLM class F420-dependent oxidoreductase [Acidimicrobiales bacterium]
MELGKVGIWSGEFRSKKAGDAGETAAELEGLGFGALWIPGGAGGDIFGVVARVLDGTRTLPVATGILNVWMHDATEVAAEHARISAAHPDRFLLGLGVSHAMSVEATGRPYERPRSVMVHYLDELDAAKTPVGKEERALAALGPKMLELARDRSAGAHPYLTTPEHTRWARTVLGEGPLLAPEQMVVLESDPTAARAVARTMLALYLQLPNYTNNMLRFGFTEVDLADGGSDRLIDGHIAWGGIEAIAGRVREHLDAGADHVCIQVLTGSRDRYPLAEWRELAAILPELQT